MKKIYNLYIIVFIAICFIPGVFTLFMNESDNMEKRELSAFPEFTDDKGKINKNWTKEFDTYFSEHFAFRNELVGLNAQLMNALFKTSAEDDVIIGKDGWLYYGYTVNDFTGISQLEDWEIEDTAHIIKMIQDYSEEFGVEFIFSAVPNKNTIYPEYMPYNYIKSKQDSVLDRLERRLSENGVNYCSLKSVLSEKRNADSEKLLYHKTDTHWNNYGAFTAYQAICDSLGIEKINIDSEGVIENSWEGDLQKMLFPDSDFLDEQINYGLENSYSYVGRFKGLDDLIINTACESKNNGLLMFRDSFGEAILPFMADSFGTAQFSRVVPYTMDLMETGSYNYAVLEIVERNLSNLRKSAPTMPSPEHEDILDYYVQDKSFTDCFSVKNGKYLKLYGEIDAAVTGDKSRRIYADVDGKTYEAFPVYEEELLGDRGKGHGYSLNLRADSVDLVEIFVETDNGFVSTGKINVTEVK